MATTQELAAWIVKNADLKGTPEFETVAQAYQVSKNKKESPASGSTGSGETDPRRGRGYNSDRSSVAPSKEEPVTKERGAMERAGSLVLGATLDPLMGLEQGLMDSPTPFGTAYRFLEAGRGKLQGGPVGQERLTQQQQEIDANLGIEKGETDWMRLFGNVGNPLNLYMGKGIGGATWGKKAMSGSAVGGISGGTTPTSEGSNEDRMVNTALGVAFGGAVPLTIDGFKAVAKVIQELPISQANKTRALQNHIADIAGDDPDTVARLLKEAEEIVPGSKPTAADALAGETGSIRLLKEQQRLAADPKLGGQFAQRDIDRQGARMAELDRAFGTPEDIMDLEGIRRSITSPLREDALKQANVYGQTAPRLQADIAAKQSSIVQSLQGQGKTLTEAEQAANRANNWSPVPGYPQFPGRYSPNTERALEFKQASQQFGDVVEQRKAEKIFKEMQLKSLNDEGFYPLETKGLLDQIEQSMKAPGSRSNALLVDAQQKVADKLRSLTDENGVIDSRDLYNVRKEIADDISSYLTSKTGNASFTTEATNVEKALKKQLDRAITKASGSDTWEKYLSNYADYSKKIDAMRVGQELKERLGVGTLGDAEKAGSFVNAILKEASTLKRATGAPRYNTMEDVLDKGQIESINRVRADLSRSKKAEALAKQIQSENPELLAGAEKTPQFLSASITVFKKVMDRLQRGSQVEFDKAMSELMLDPKQLGLFIESLPKKDAPQVATALYRRSSPQLRQMLETYGIGPQTRGLSEGAVTRGAITGIGQEE